MANKRSKSKQVNRGERERIARLKKQKEEARLLEVEEIEEPLDEQAMEPETEELEKDYGMDSPMMEMPTIGPTSFEELDAVREAQKRADEVREVTYDVQDLVWNILHDPSVDAGQKAKKIMGVASGFEARVSQSVTEDMQKDIEVLEIEAILAMDERARNHNLIKKGAEDLVDFAKKKLTSKKRDELADSDFALPAKRKYPIMDKAHVRNALARAAQQMQAGGEAAADAKAAMPKIRAAAKKFGIDMMEKGLHIEKDAKGDWRWIGRPSNNFIDWQNDIMSKSAHQKYVAWLDQNTDMAPLFLKWHTPGTAREYSADFWMEHEGALIMSGKLTEDEARQILSMQKQVDLGMSVQGIGLRLNKEDPREITDYWLYEVSDLPLENAANPFTSLETITKEVGMDKLKYLTDMMGSEEKAKEFLLKTGQMQKELQEAGITSKEKKEIAETVSAPEPVDVESLVKQLTEKFDLDGLNAFVAQAQEAMEKVPLLEAMIKEVKLSDDQRLADQLTPPAMRFAWSRKNLASQSGKNVLKKADEEPEDEEGDEDNLLRKSVPTAHWLSEATGSAPIPVDQEV